MIEIEKPPDEPPAVMDAPPLARSHTVPLWAMPVLGLLAVLSLILRHGFPIGLQFGRWFDGFDALLAAAFCAGIALVILPAKKRREAIYHRRFELVILAAFLLGLLLVAVLPGELFAQWTPGGEPLAWNLAFGVVRLFLLANVCVGMLRFLQRIFLLGVRVEVVLAGSFGALILFGALLLLMPRVGANPEAPITLLDAFFTSTSAVCVTGLVVRDTGADFTTLGQMIILSLFQIGGLGIVTFVAFISAFSSKTLPVPQMVAFRSMINAPALSDLKRRLAGIIVLAALIEGIGAASLFSFAPPGANPLEQLKWSLFHSVSAFCNAGFALQPTSLEFARAHIGINVTIMTLIVLGGLGFLVLPELIVKAARALRRAPLLLQPMRSRFTWGTPARLTIQTRISLHVTGWLIVIGMAGFWLLESEHILRGETIGETLLASAFQSITTRTAGFNTLPIGDLRQSTLLLVMMLMVVGGCPVSAAGGIKTVTVGVLFLAMRSMIVRKENVEAFGRTLPPRAFLTALSVFMLYMLTAGAGVFLLSIFDPQILLRDLMFETISALSTVGLSTGITAELSAPGRVVLCVLMFVGRVGPIALVLSVFQARGRVEYEFPSEDVVVG